MAAVLGRGCRAITQRLGQLSTCRAAKQPELGTEILAFEVNVVKATALPSPAPAAAVTQPCPSRSNKTSPKRSTPSPGCILVTFSIFLAPKRPRDAFLPSEIVL